MQFITFGFACTPLYFVWEKVVGMHDTKSICLRALVRLPVVIPIWFLAIIFPFFGPINSAVGALLVSFTVYIIPALAHMLTYRSASARQVNDLVFVHLIFSVFVSCRRYEQVMLALPNADIKLLFKYIIGLSFSAIIIKTNLTDMYTDRNILHVRQQGRYTLGHTGCLACISLRS